MMAEAAGFVHREFQHLLGVGGKVNFAAAEMSHGGNALDHFAHTRGFQSQLAQDTARDAAILVRETEEQVFGADGVLLGAFSLGVSQAQHAACSLGKSFHASHNFSNSNRTNPVWKYFTNNSGFST
jgi:hypothetical protein